MSVPQFVEAVVEEVPAANAVQDEEPALLTHSTRYI